MKNQYVGDIGDFGKYALLRAFIDAGVKVGVNWYLTENDGSADGKFTEYLIKEKLRVYHREIFDALKGVAFDTNKSVRDIESMGILPGALFYRELLKPIGGPAEREEIRKQWFLGSISELVDAKLIFMDPDNGLLVGKNASMINAEKYILPEEAETYYHSGHNVVYYCHKGRRRENDWREYLSYMFERIPDAKPIVLTYHKGSQRSYVFLIHPEDFVEYHRVIDSFMKDWYKLFSEEFTTRGDVARGDANRSILFTLKDGSELTLSRRDDGRLEVNHSRKPGTAMILEPDHVAELLGVRWI